MNRKIVSISAILLLGILLASGCSPKESSTISIPEITGVNRENTDIDLPSISYLQEVSRISVEEVKTKLDAGIRIIIIDVRSRTEYQESHIAGALSTPTIEDLIELYSDLNIYDEIITYCTWPDEQASARAASLLMEAGYTDVKAIKGGFAAWKAEGFSVESTSQVTP